MSHFTSETVRDSWKDDTWVGDRDGYFSAPCDYERLIQAVGPVLLQVDDDDYQGDSRVLFKDGERYGVLIFGWGSCSGCDALQAAGSWQDVAEIGNDMVRDTKWFDGAAEALSYFETHDWEGDYSWHQEETRRFINEAKAILAPTPGAQS